MEDHASERFRAELRAFLDARLPADLRGVSDQYHCANKAAMIRWKNILREQGWLANAWPVEYGGCGWTQLQQWIFRHECAEARAPVMDMHGLKMVGPVIYSFGSKDQKAFYLPRILSSEHWWCQGFSEPGAGSDLAALRTRARRDGDHYILSGEKVWTTYAHIANMAFVLARTSPDGRPSDGLSFLLVPMDAAGVSVHPITTIDGQHHFNRVVFDDVRVPVADRVGEENAGWRYARFLLDNERLGGSASEMCRIYLAEAKRSFCALHVDERAPLLAKLSRLEQRFAGLVALERTSMQRVLSSEGGRLASMLKIIGADLQQDLAQFALAANGPLGSLSSALRAELGLRDGGVGVAERFFYSRAASIYGGSNEIQRNIIARSLELK